MVEGIRACLFDVFGTVVDWQTGVSRALAASASARSVSGVDWLTVASIGAAGTTRRWKKFAAGGAPGSRSTCCTVRTSSTFLTPTVLAISPTRTSMK